MEERGYRWIQGFPTEPLIFANSFDARTFTQVHPEVSPQFPPRGGVSTFIPCAAWPPFQRRFPWRARMLRGGFSEAIGVAMALRCLRSTTQKHHRPLDAACEGF